MPKCCKVIVTSYSPRKERLDKLPPHHNQRGRTPLEVHEILKTIVDLEQAIDPGMAMDTIIVNNNSGFLSGNKYLESINGISIKRGKLIVLHRENYGYSFAGYNHAFSLFRSSYNTWMFAEDDLLLVENGYMRICFDLLRQNKEAGFISLIDQDPPFRIPSGLGATKTSVLREIVRQHGCLPHCPLRDANYANTMEYGEKRFAAVIKVMKLKVIRPKTQLYLPLYDYELKLQAEQSGTDTV
jgi:hypothetical protein